MRVKNAAELGAAIRKRRLELGYTQAELAGFCACSTVFLSQLENGKERAEIGKAFAIINTLGLDVDASARGGDPL